MIHAKPRILDGIYIVVCSGCLSALLVLFSVSRNWQYMPIALSTIILITLVGKGVKPLLYSYKQYFPFLVWILSFGIRYSYCLYVNPQAQQVSDFSFILSEAINGPSGTEYYKYYLHKFLYPFLLHFLGFRTQIGVLLFQCIVAASTSLLIFLLGKEIGGTSLAFLAAIIHVFWPSQIVYVSITSEEHVAALLVVALLILLIKFERFISAALLSPPKRFKDYRPFIIKLLGAGTICGLAPFFKDWAIIVLVAAIICAFNLLFKYCNTQRIALLLSIVCLFLCRATVQRGITHIAEQYLGTDANNNVIIWQMYESLDPGGSGAWDPIKVEEFQEIMQENNFNFDEGNKQALKILGERVSANLDQMPSFLLKKGVASYSNDDDIFWWSFDSLLRIETNSVFPSLTSLIRHFGNIYYIVIIIGILISAFTIRDRHTFFILLVILGAILSSLLIECQGRYKYSIEPIFAICLSNAIATLSTHRIARMNRMKA